MTGSFLSQLGYITGTGVASGPPSGAGRTVTFELRYPDRRSQWLRQTTNARGTAQLRVHVLHLRPGRGPLVARLSATMRSGRRVLVRWTSFEILPPHARGSRRHDSHAT